MLMLRPEFRGPAFSWGDCYVKTLGSNPDGGRTGSATTWLSASVNHHLTYVARQVAQVCGVPVQGIPRTEIELLRAVPRKAFEQLEYAARRARRPAPPDGSTAPVLPVGAA